MARRSMALMALMALVALALVACAEGRPLRDLLQMISVRPTPFNPFVGPVVTSTNVRPTPFNPFIGPIVTQNSVALPNLLG
ncbi:hypothetical protein Rsub_11000 [Raphidocelis subcapitata]|uniref:Uncharacterized protein n=1 Tax=Raphidocelis subcapitata TaxID=307507 RepID=A0A2V0PHF7_9CHLO|nr:hypothetical protein Rsub_11000 [Raphidocelis subcapitata]|eukprot:GBF97353.1 hypothetical protein Rsub_11000 [Raphidocelis subcapitata]